MQLEATLIQKKIKWLNAAERRPLINFNFDLKLPDDSCFVGEDVAIK